MIKEKKIIQLQQSPFAIGGLHIHDLKVVNTEVFKTHREDHLCLLILKKGSVTLNVDLNTIVVSGQTILFLNPLQAHSLERIAECEGWFLSIECFLVPKSIMAFFNTISVKDQKVMPIETDYKSISAISELIFSQFHSDNNFKTTILKGLFEALIYNVALVYEKNNPASFKSKGQSQKITTDFKTLLNSTLFYQTPKQYADKLNISTSHLNDCVKSSTGFTSTYWIRYTLIIEAKRQLFYTDISIKELAYGLGFEEQTYFSRLFKQVAGITPQSFRKKFRE